MRGLEQAVGKGDETEETRYCRVTYTQDIADTSNLSGDIEDRLEYELRRRPKRPLGEGDCGREPKSEYWSRPVRESPSSFIKEANFLGSMMVDIVTVEGRSRGRSRKVRRHDKGSVAGVSVRDGFWRRRRYNGSWLAMTDQHEGEAKTKEAKTGIKRSLGRWSWRDGRDG